MLLCRRAAREMEENGTKAHTLQKCEMSIELLRRKRREK